MTTIKIGWISGLTGSQATNSVSATQGIATAVQQINKTHAAGKNVKLSIVTVDDAADPQTASQRCNQLVNQNHVQVVIGFESTPATAACLQYTSKANIPYILGQTATSGALCDANYYALATVGNQQVTPLVKYLLKKGSQKFYVVASDFISGRQGAQQIKDAVGSNGQVVGTSFEPIGTTDFSSDISKIAAAKPDTVIDVLVGSDEVAFYKQFRTDPRSNGIKTGSFLMDDGIAAAIGQKLLKNTVVNSSYALNNPSKANKVFKAAVTKKYGKKTAISGAAAAAWDGAWILANALKSSGGATGAALSSAIAQSKYIGPRGGLVFKGKHYVSLTAYLVAYDGKKGTVVGDYRNINPVPANAACR
ncbi:MAG TPA: ABC transporter substrate-binding protein [Gaiellaceae bacterium]|nr:ABC transporter substrate-binding protein [Gaiellaceae bacterium]